MAEDPTTTTTTTLTDAPARPEGVPPVLDEAHIGDIRGALGTISMHDSGERHGWRSRSMALLAIMGPGLIVMVGDNDAGGVSTYAQAGQNYGTSLLWVLVLLVPVLIVNQEMVIRLGAVTGVGHARLIFERFGKFWGAFSVGDLFLLNFLTIVTEFIGVSLALGYFGVSKYLAVPIAAVALVAITSTGSFRSWERFMYVFVVANFLVIPLLILAHPQVGNIAQHTVVPSIAGGANSTAVLLIIAIVGTTVAPWQLFFQQSNIIDKRITPRWINYERADTVIGAFVVVIGAGALIAVTAFAFAGTPYFGQFSDAGTVATDLGRELGSTAGTMFAIVLLNASLIGAAAVTLATSYAFGDVFGAKHSLNRGPLDAKLFYASFALMVAAAAGIVLDTRRPAGVDHHLGAGARGRAAAERDRVSAAAVQRPRGARTVVQRPVAERGRERDRRRAGRAVADSDGEHDVPEGERDADVPVPLARLPSGLHRDGDLRCPQPSGCCGPCRGGRADL